MKLFKIFTTLLAACALLAVGIVPSSAAGEKTFTQGLWRGQDPRASFDAKSGYYY